MRLFKPNVQKMQEKKNVRGLIRALKDDDQNVRDAAAIALARIGAPAVEPLIAILKDRRGEPLIFIPTDKYWVVRRAAEGTLAQICDTGAVKPLCAALKDSDLAVRRAAADALVRIGMHAVEPLIAALRDSDRHVREAAAEALVKIGVPAVEPLIAVLRDNKSDARAAATEALVKIGVLAVEPLITVLRDNKSDARAAATEALVKIGVPAVEPLVAALKDGERVVRHRAATALGQIGDARAVEPLVAALKDENWDVRQAVAWALERIGLPTNPAIQAWCAVGKRNWAHAISLGSVALEPLIAMLKDSNSGIRKAAAEALGQVGDARAVEPLVAALKDENWDVRQAVAEALGQIGDARAVEPLIDALRDEDRHVRKAAAGALEKIGLPVDPATQAWNAVGKEDWTRAISLGNVAVEPLCVALKDGERVVRRRAAESLGQIGDARAVEPLIAALKDEAAWVREAVAEAMGQISDARVVEPLIAALKDEYGEVRSAVVKTLGKIGLPADANLATQALYAVGMEDWVRAISLGDVAVEPLIATLRYTLLKDTSAWEVRRAAANALVTLYREGKLDAQAKQKILAMRKVMAEPHYDSHRSNDCGSHSDSGIGVTF